MNHIALRFLLENTTPRKKNNKKITEANHSTHTGRARIQTHTTATQATLLGRAVTPTMVDMNLVNQLGSKMTRSWQPATAAELRRGNASSFGDNSAACTLVRNACPDELRPVWRMKGGGRGVVVVMVLHVLRQHSDNQCGLHTC